MYEGKLRFFTNITHEFCTPLTLIYGPCERILNYEHSDDFIKKYAQIIKSNTERLNSLIQEVIDFRRMETGNQICHIQELNISELGNGIIESFDELAEQNRIQLETDITPDIIWRSDHNGFTKILNNLISNAFKYTPENGTIRISIKKEEDKNKKIAKIILILMGVILVVIIGLIGAMAYIKSSELQVYLNGSANPKIKEMMVIEDDGTIYFPIKEIASYLGYKSYNGEYSDKSEDKNKCYVQCNDEVANFTLNSKKIYKLTTTQNNSNYEYYYTEKPVKAINGKLYATSDGIEKAFNVSFSFNNQTNKGYIYTMPYLIETYTSKVLDYGYSKIDENFTNQKSVLNSMLIVYKEDDKSYGVIDLKGNAIIEAKYNGITFLPNTGDFLVKSNNKVGTISEKRETKIPINYDSLELIDSDLALYLAKKDNKYGIIDSRGNVKIYIEYDEIGIDNTKFEKN